MSVGTISPRWKNLPLIRWFLRQYVIKSSHVTIGGGVVVVFYNAPVLCV